MLYLTKLLNHHIYESQGVVNVTLCCLNVNRRDRPNEKNRQKISCKEPV